MFSIKQIKNIIAQDNLEAAIKAILCHQKSIRPDWLVDLFILSRDLYSVKKAIISGLISWEIADFKRRQIAFRLLLLVDAIISNFPEMGDKSNNVN